MEETAVEEIEPENLAEAVTEEETRSKTSIDLRLGEDFASEEKVQDDFYFPPRKFTFFISHLHLGSRFYPTCRIDLNLLDLSFDSKARNDESALWPVKECLTQDVQA